MKRTLSANSYFFRAKVFAYMMVLSAMFYLFFNVFRLLGLE
ncbi:MAG: hypothetical protein WAZ98_06790 [Cyclobacteriaceae bacterium]